MYNNIHRGVYATSGVANGLLTGNRKSLNIFPPIKKVKCPYTLYVMLDVKGYAEIKHYEKKVFNPQYI